MSKLTAHTNTHNEGGEGFNPHIASMIATAEAKAEARIQHIIANVASYKAAWNAAVSKRAVGGNLTMAQMVEIEQEVGVTRLEMAEVKSRMA